MTTPGHLWHPPPVYSLAVRSRAARYRVHRMFCVGRNHRFWAVCSQIAPIGQPE